MAVGNLEFIKSASGTSVSSLSVTDCFSASYDVYYVSVTDLNTSASNFQYARFIDSGGVDSTTNYDTANLSLRNWTTYSEQRSVNQTSIQYISYRDASTTTGTGIGMYVFNPFDSSSYTFTKAQSSTQLGAGTFGTKHISVHKVAEEITGINFFPASGTYNNISINVYGVK